MPQHRPHPVSIDDFLNLSGAISLHLAAKRLNRNALLRLIVGSVPVLHEAALLEALTYLRHGYGDRRRKNGPLAILHPFRTAAYLARSMPEPTALDLLGALLHDVGEDVTIDDVGPERWETLQRDFAVMRDTIDQDHQWFLGERIALLARKPDQSYHDYVRQVLANAERMPDLLHSKLADRIDNTLDIAVQHPGWSQADFYEVAFGTLFLPNFELSRRERDSLADEDASVLLLSQLHKNIVLMSMLRKEKLDTLDETTKRLFHSLADVSCSQAQWIAVDSLSRTIPDQAARRRILVETMEYCTTGGIDSITPSSRGGVLDGTLLERFGAHTRAERKENLADIHKDKDLLCRLMVCFIAVFTAFLDVPGYYIHGVAGEDIAPVR